MTDFITQHWTEITIVATILITTWRISSKQSERHTEIRLAFENLRMKITELETILKMLDSRYDTLRDEVTILKRDLKSVFEKVDRNMCDIKDIEERYRSVQDRKAMLG
jgi:cell fate regulator YaaT (PSP1 superfamily)